MMRTPGLAPSPHVDLGLAILRVVTGVLFVALGADKLSGAGPSGIASAVAAIDVPLAGLVRPLVALLEVGGGLALIAGLLTRPVARALAATMLGALLIMHPPAGSSLPDGYALVLALLGAAAALGASGAGKWSVDARIGTRPAGAPARDGR